MFYLRLGIIFRELHPFDLNVIATTAWIVGEDSPRHCAMFPRATLSSDSILRSHQDNFSRGSSPSGIIYNIFTIFTLHYLHFTILLTRFTIFTQPVTATQQREINLSTHHHRCRQCDGRLNYCNSVLHPLLQRHTSLCGHFYHFHQP